MPHCPQCFAEYIEGSRECIDCGVPLLPGVPPPSSSSQESREPRLIRIRVFSGPTARLDANLARTVLENSGIPSVLPGEKMAQAVPGIDVIQLLVREENAREAAEILAGCLDSGTPAADESK